jgi:phosphotransferase system  glucose/maltose/N-acetylglucosamine-specific IIC component
MVAVVLVLLSIFLVLGKRDLVAASVRPFFGLLLVCVFLGAALNYCGSATPAIQPEMSGPVPLIVIGYSAIVAFWLYRRFGRRHRERQEKEHDRTRDAERVRVYPPDDGADADVR